VAPLAAGCEFSDDVGVDAVLRVDEALEIIRIGHGAGLLDYHNRNWIGSSKAGDHEGRPYRIEMA
jgi:hypothetical protein